MIGPPCRYIVYKLHKLTPLPLLALPTPQRRHGPSLLLGPRSQKLSHSARLSLYWRPALRLRNPGRCIRLSPHPLNVHNVALNVYHIALNVHPVALNFHPVPLTAYPSPCIPQCSPFPVPAASPLSTELVYWTP
eukprot:1186738-Prorocentrum_minimum.AAC.1